MIGSIKYNLLFFLLVFLSSVTIINADEVKSDSSNSALWQAISAAGDVARSEGRTISFTVGQFQNEYFVGDEVSLSSGYLQPDNSEPCCEGMTGNIDGSLAEAVDIADLVYLVQWLFSGGSAPQCLAEANIDGDISGTVDISDVVDLIAYMFFQGVPPAECFYQ